MKKLSLLASLLMTISAGDRVIAINGADGKLVALKVLSPTLSGERCIAALTADGKLVAVKVAGVLETGQQGIGAFSADGKLIPVLPYAVPPASRPDCLDAEFSFVTVSTAQRATNANYDGFWIGGTASGDPYWFGFTLLEYDTPYTYALWCYYIEVLTYDEDGYPDTFGHFFTFAGTCDDFSYETGGTFEGTTKEYASTSGALISASNDEATVTPASGSTTTLGTDFSAALDVNSDLIIDASDLIQVREHIGDYPPGVEDVNSDGVVNIIDMMLVHAKIYNKDS